MSEVVIQNNALHSEVSKLIERKLKLLRRKQTARLIGVQNKTSAQIDKSVKRGLASRKAIGALYMGALPAYKEIVAVATAVTNEWPVLTWEAIESILIKGRVGLVHNRVILDIVDKHAWAIGQRPWTMNWINSERFCDSVMRQLSRFGIHDAVALAAFETRLTFEHGLAEVGIINLGNEAISSVHIAVDEHVLAARWATAPADQQVPVPSIQQVKTATKQVIGSRAKNPEISKEEWFSKNGTKAANARHERPGGSRDKKRQIQAIWATGKYTTKNLCAEEEYDGLGMSFSVARKALRNMPTPTKA